VKTLTIWWAPSIGYNHTYHESVLQLSKVSFWRAHRVPPLQMNIYYPSSKRLPLSRLRLCLLWVGTCGATAPNRTNRAGKLINSIRISVCYQPDPAKWRYWSIVYLCLSMLIIKHPYLPSASSAEAKFFWQVDATILCHSRLYPPVWDTKNLASEHAYVC
jgi:hypothetical protein